MRNRPDSETELSNTRAKNVSPDGFKLLHVKCPPIAGRLSPTRISDPPCLIPSCTDSAHLRISILEPDVPAEECAGERKNFLKECVEGMVNTSDAWAGHGRTGEGHGLSNRDTALERSDFAHGADRSRPSGGSDFNPNIRPRGTSRRRRRAPPRRGVPGSRAAS